MCAMCEGELLPCFIVVPSDRVGLVLCVELSLNDVHDVKQVACDMGYTGEDGDERLQLVSFHSTSKVANDSSMRDGICPALHFV